MKHTIKVTSIVLLMFLLAQLIGLVIVKQYLPRETLPFNIEKPQLEEQTSFIPLFITIIIATLLALILIRFSAMRLWKLWFFLSVLFTLVIAFAAFIPQAIALILALILALWKVLRPNIYIHNLTELFIYGGLAAIFVPVLSIFSVSILMILIAIYDMIAVWKTKHMIKLAKFQASSKTFAGLLMPYSLKKPKSKKGVSKKIIVPVRTAILGGGDIGFPLLFAGVILKISNSFLNAFIISIFAALALMFLFIIAEKKKFYPAMPFIAVGCFIGYLVTLIIFI